MKTTTSSTDTLCVVDKINLAACAAKRSSEHWMDNERFFGEIATVLLWKHHNTYQSSHKGELYHYVLK